MNELTRQEFSSTSHPLRHPGGHLLQIKGGGVEVSDFELTTSRLILQFTDTPTLYSSGLTCLFFCICTNVAMQSIALLAYVYESTIYTKCTP